MSQFGRTGAYNLYNLQYPDPFLDQASIKLPKNRQKFLETLYLFGTTHAQLSPIIHKIAKYPITHLIVKSKNGQTSLERKWKDHLEDDLDIYDVAVGAGLDFMGYGEVFLTIQRPFIRIYTCNSCGADHQAGTLQYHLSGEKIHGVCPACKGKVTFKAVDKYTDVPEDIAVVRIPPQEMHVRYNKLSGQYQYRRTVPSELKKAIKKTGKPDYFLIDTTPWIYVQAAMRSKQIVYGKNKILHVKAPSMSGRDQHRGLPIILPALKDAYQNQIHKKSDETVANERAVPARFVYPQSTSRDAIKHISLAKWSQYMQQVLRLRRFDHNAVMPVPFPVGVAEVGGDVSRLTSIQIRQFLVQEMIGATGLPSSFLSSDMTYSGGIHQTRMLENMMGPYLRAQKKILKFITKNVSKITEWEEPEDIRWKEFRKADDIQVIHILLQLMQMGHVSAKEVLDRLDLDWADQHEEVMRESEKLMDWKVKDMLLEFKAALDGLDLQAGATAGQEGAQQLAIETHESGERFQASTQNTGISAEEKAKKYFQLSEEARDGYLESIYDQDPEEYKVVSNEIEMMEARNNAKNAKDMANKIIMIDDPGKKREMLKRIADANPQFASLVMGEIQKMFAGRKSSGGGMSAPKEAPQQKPPRQQ